MQFLRSLFVLSLESAKPRSHGIVPHALLLVNETFQPYPCPTHVTRPGLNLWRLYGHSGKSQAPPQISLILRYFLEGQYSVIWLVLNEERSLGTSASSDGVASRSRSTFLFSPRQNPPPIVRNDARRESCRSHSRSVG